MTPIQHSKITISNSTAQQCLLLIFWYIVFHMFVYTSSEIRISQCSWFGIQYFPLKIVNWIFHTILQKHVLQVVSYSIIKYSVSLSYGTYFTLFCIKPREKLQKKTSLLFAKSQARECLCPSNTQCTQALPPSWPQVDKATSQVVTRHRGPDWWQVSHSSTAGPPVLPGSRKPPAGGPCSCCERLGWDWTWDSQPVDSFLPVLCFPLVLKLLSYVQASLLKVATLHSPAVLIGPADQPCHWPRVWSMHRNDSNPGVRLVGKRVGQGDSLHKRPRQGAMMSRLDPGLALPGRRLQADRRDEKAQLGQFIKGALMAIFLCL